MLNAITLKIGELLGADRTTVFLLDEDQNELWSLIAKDEGKGSLEIRIPLNQGIAGQVARSKEKVNIPFDFYEYAEAVVGMLNEYFNVMVEPIFNHKGTLDKYMGDAIMGVFGSPIPLEDHAWKAVQTALDMRSALIQFNQQRLAQKQPPIRIGIGIHSGNAISGNIGHSRRMEFTVIGDDVNLGSRLEGTTKRYNCDIIISGNTYQLCAEQLIVRELDIVRVKGKTQPVSLYELVGEKSAVISDQRLEAIALYEAGRKAYLNRDFTTALGKFAAVLSLTPEDSAATLHIQRCQHWLKTPLPANWDGVENLTEK
nr:MULTISPECIES: adenylate/guanylate cyclase domain-containing protein [Planktothrix]